MSALRAMNPVYFVAWCIFRFLFKFYCGWSVYNPERVPLKGPVILASNHASILDPPLIGSGIHRGINYLARETLFEKPIVGWVLRNWTSVPADCDDAGSAACQPTMDRRLAGGGIILFPEGTRTRDGKLQPARAGIGLTVIKSEAPVVPVRVFGTLEAMSRGQHLPRPHHVAVKYGKPMMFEALRAEAKTSPKPRLKEIYQQIADEIMDAIAKLEPCEDKESFP